VELVLQACGKRVNGKERGCGPFQEPHQNHTRRRLLQLVSYLFSVEEVLLHMVETQEEQDRWLLENRAMVNAKIKTGIDQLDRGEGIPEDQLDAHLAKLKSQS